MVSPSAISTRTASSTIDSDIDSNHYQLGNGLSLEA